MSRRKGEIRFATRVREYPYPTTLQVDHRTRWQQLRLLHAIATRMTNGDFLTSAPRGIEAAIRYHFRRPDLAHAMQILGEANAAPYDPWAERLESWAETRRSLEETDHMVNAAAASGALLRLFRWPARLSERAAWLRELEPGFDQMAAMRAVELMRAAIARLDEAAG